MKQLLIILLSLWTTVSLNPKPNIEGVYFGYWGRTTWMYSFNGDGIYRLEVTGHAGDFELFGIYEVVGDTVKLLSSEDNRPIRELIVHGDTCLTEKSESAYKYCKVENDIYQKLLREFEDMGETSRE